MNLFDIHFDLLSFILKNNRAPLKDKINIATYIDEVYNKNNIDGGILTMWFMKDIKLMKEELFIESDELNDITAMFKETINFIKNETNLNLENFIFGIEGATYIKDITMVNNLYKEGLRSLQIVCSDDNKYGCNCMTLNDTGLSYEGEILIKECIKLNIIIDLSHASINTFDDIYNLCKKHNYRNIIASHSNVYNLCESKRNLDDSQLLKIKELGGIVGIVEYKPFVSKDITTDYIQKYIDHIVYLYKLFDSSKHISLSTDDMTFDTYDPLSHTYKIIEHKDFYKIKSRLVNQKIFTQEEVNNICCNNILNIIRRVK